MTIRQRIMTFLQTHPDGIDDDDLAKVLQLSARQQANIRCRELEKEGLVIRRLVNGKIQNFWAGKDVPLPAPVELALESDLPKFDYWFWEGNVQSKVVSYLEKQDYKIVSTADTASHQTGIDVVAERGGMRLWVTVKGYPKGTAKTKPSVQASHWFKQAVFDIVAYRGRDRDVLLATALPDFPRYRKLAEKVSWFKPVARFSYFWVDKNGNVSVE
jgi:hypothetical protein